MKALRFIEVCAGGRAPVSSVVGSAISLTFHHENFQLAGSAALVLGSGIGVTPKCLPTELLRVRIFRPI